MRRGLAFLALAASLIWTWPAAAQSGAAQDAPWWGDLFGRDTLSGMLDLRLVGADGEDSFLRGGFGKTEASGAGSGVAVRPMADLAALAWRPELADNLSAYVLVQNQPYQYHAVDVAEAYLRYKPLPRPGRLNYGLRAGLMWPPVSLEHDGPAWTTTRTLTPSAINTWIAEEIKVVGVEGTLDGEIAGNRLGLTAAVFGDNDTAGTLLAYRGWALDDTRSTLFGQLALPAGPPRAEAYYAQASLELDGRPGGYIKLDWRPPAPVSLQAFYYDNGGNPYLFKDGQWSWRTTFGDVGMTARPAQDVEILAQAMKGRTYYGDAGGPVNLDVDFAAAYVLATRVVGRSRFTVRADWFETQDQSYLGQDRGERGKAATADYAFALTPHLSLWIEAIHVWSNRPARTTLGLPATDPQNVLQIALRARL